tara:strand:- start:51 stop:605 length:555 start_codon:yes stop_codon:yes gene_type:complete
MALRKPEKKEDMNPQKPKEGLGARLKRQGLTAPKYKKRNPHKDSGDKKPSFKVKSSIIKDKVKKGQGLAKGGVIKKANRPGSSIKVKEIGFPSPTDFNKLRSTASTIQPKTLGNAKRFVDIRTRVKKAGGYAMGGEASESVARSKILDEMRKRKRKKLIDRVNRIPQGAGKPKIVPKKKPKRDK